MSRLHWASETLNQAGAIFHPTRGVWQISELGSKWLNIYPEGIPREIVLKSDGVVAWANRSNKPENSASEKNDSVANNLVESGTPVEQIETAIDSLSRSVKDDILERLRTESSTFFEHVVLDLLTAMGYGVGDEKARHLGGRSDGGVDGVLNQDELGLDQIYVQAKRYGEGNNVSTHEIRDFNTAIETHQASRGVFITTSKFTSEARSVLERLRNSRIVLIDDEKLCDLLIAHGVGVAIERTYHVYKVDENFFVD